MQLSYSIADAKNHLPELVHTVEHESAIQLTRRGKPVAVLLSIHEYEQLQRGKLGFWDAYLQFRQQIDAEKLDLNPDEAFATVRDQAPGREASW